MADSVVELLLDEWARLDSLCSDLTESEWKVSVPLPGWTVQDCISHTIGIELMLLGEAPPTLDLSHLDYITDPINEMLESYVEVRRPLPGNEVLAQFRDIVSRRTSELLALTPDDLERIGPSPVGDVPYREFMLVRLFDCWMHEQDIRLGLDRPGHSSGPIVETVLGRFPPALGFVVGKRAGAPDGSSVVFDLLDGPIGSFAVVVEGRARVVDVAPDDPTVRIIVPFTSFVALCGGRWSAEQAEAAGRLTLEGDADLGARVLGSLAFTP